MKKFNKLVTTTVAGAFAATLSMSSFAGAFGNDGMTGKHWQVNLIGVSRDKAADMTDSHRRSIFVPLETYSGEVERQIKIKYVPGPDFQVLDGNATDDGEAIIQVPYEYCEDYDAGCTDLLAYDVYAIALGKPNGSALVTAECEYTADVVDPNGTEGLECEDTLLMGSFDITRTKGKPTVKDITKIFRAEGCLDMAEIDGSFDGVCETGDLEFRNLWIFNIEQLESYMWDYGNHGLKLMQIRFYPSDDNGYIGTVK